MKLVLEEKEWNKTIETNSTVEYDNYISGFTPISDKGFTFDTIFYLDIFGVSLEI